MLLAHDRVSIRSSSAAWSARLRKRDAERLEDRLEHVLRVGSVHQAHVQGERGAVDELAQKRGDDVGRHAAEPRARQIDVGDEQRLVARLERDVRERLRGGHDGGSVAAAPFDPQRLCKRLAERASCRTHLFLRVSGSHLEREVERGIAREQSEQVVEHGHARRDVRLALADDDDADLRARFVFRIRSPHDARERTGTLYTLERWAERPMPISNKRNTFATGMRVHPQALAASAFLAIFAASPAHASHVGAVGPTAHEWPAGEVSVGYSSLPALNSALARYHVRIVRRLPAPAHVVQVAARQVTQRRSRRPCRASPAFASCRDSPPAATTWNRHSRFRSGAHFRGSGVPRDALRQRIRPAVLRAASAITIAVIDTGADVTAPDLAAKAPTVYNQRTGTSDVRDTVGHGTFVASLAAGSVTNEDGIAGAGGDAQLLVVKAGNGDGSFTDVDEAAGIMYAVDHGAKIVNLSVGGATTSTTEQHAIDYAVQKGVLVVAAVGNEYSSGNPVEYPAALLQPAGSNGVGGSGLAVTASGPTGLRAHFANTGSWVSLAAPGENVFGAVSQDSSPAAYPRSPLPGAQSGLYGYASGTSFAAPQVAGAAALVWAANPSLTGPQVAQILKETASGAGRWTPELGFGVIDVAAAVARAQTGAPGVLLSGNHVATHVQLNWSGDATRYALSLSKDSSPATTVLSGTQTSTALTLARGHSYSFTVTALDASGAATATSAPLTVAVAARSRH